MKNLDLQNVINTLKKEQKKYKENEAWYNELKSGITFLEKLNSHDELIALDLPKWIDRYEAMERIIETKCVQWQLVGNKWTWWWSLYS